MVTPIMVSCEIAPPVSLSISVPSCDFESFFFFFFFGGGGGGVMAATTMVTLINHKVCQFSGPL